MKQPHNLHRLDERAGVDLKLIRSMMQQAVRVVPMPGWGLFAVGCVGVVASVLTSQWRGTDWVLGWLATAAIAASMALLISSWHIRKTGKSIYVGSYQRFWLSLLPAFVSAGVLSGILFSLDQTQWLPTLWLLLYGVAVIAASNYSIAQVRWMGVAFLLLGALSAISLTPAVAMGLGFGGIHLIFGLLIARANRDQNSE